MADSNKDATIRGQWSIGQAVAYYNQQAKGGAFEKDDWGMKNIEGIATEFYNMVDRIVEAGNVVEEAEASEASVKYLKSLLMQNARGQLKGNNVDDFLKNNLHDELTQNVVSKLIDDIKNDRNYVANWIGDVKDYLPTDSGEVYETKEEKAEIEEAKNASK